MLLLLDFFTGYLRCKLIDVSADARERFETRVSSCVDQPKVRILHMIPFDLTSARQHRTKNIFLDFPLFDNCAVDYESFFQISTDTSLDSILVDQLNKFSARMCS